MRPNFNLMKATLTGALGGLLFGFDTVVISGAIDALVRLYGLSPQGKGWTVAIGLVGTVVGALGAGVVGQRLGGRETLRMTAIALCHLGHRLRAGVELAVVHGLPVCGRAGHRRVVGAGAGVHCGAGSGQVARAAGGRIPVQRGVRHSGGLRLELLIRTLHLGATEWRWQVGVAACRPSASWRCCSAFRAARAGRLAQSHRRSAGSAEADGRAGPAGRTGRHSQPR
jgi:MFS transporter, SP family, arabinose:H+ symporter